MRMRRRVKEVEKVKVKGKKENQINEKQLEDQLQLQLNNHHHHNETLTIRKDPSPKHCESLTSPSNKNQTFSNNSNNNINTNYNVGFTNNNDYVGGSSRNNGSSTSKNNSLRGGPSDSKHFDESINKTLNITIDDDRDISSLTEIKLSHKHLQLSPSINRPSTAPHQSSSSSSSSYLPHRPSSQRPTSMAPPSELHPVPHPQSGSHFSTIRTLRSKLFNNSSSILPHSSSSPVVSSAAPQPTPSYNVRHHQPHESGNPISISHHHNSPIISKPLSAYEDSEIQIRRQQSFNLSNESRRPQLVSEIQSDPIFNQQHQSSNTRLRLKKLNQSPSILCTTPQQGPRLTRIIPNLNNNHSSSRSISSSLTSPTSSISACGEPQPLSPNLLVPSNGHYSNSSRPIQQLHIPPAHGGTIAPITVKAYPKLPQLGSKTPFQAPSSSLTYRPQEQFKLALPPHQSHKPLDINLSIETLSSSVLSLNSSPEESLPPNSSHNLDHHHQTPPSSSESSSIPQSVINEHNSDTTLNDASSTSTSFTSPSPTSLDSSSAPECLATKNYQSKNTPALLSKSVSRPESLLIIPSQYNESGLIQNPSYLSSSRLISTSSLTSPIRLSTTERLEHRSPSENVELVNSDIKKLSLGPLPKLAQEHSFSDLYTFFSNLNCGTIDCTSPRSINPKSNLSALLKEQAPIPTKSLVQPFDLQPLDVSRISLENIIQDHRSSEAAGKNSVVQDQGFQQDDNQSTTCVPSQLLVSNCLPPSETSFKLKLPLTKVSKNNILEQNVVGTDETTIKVNVEPGNVEIAEAMKLIAKLQSQVDELRSKSENDSFSNDKPSFTSEVFRGMPLAVDLGAKSAKLDESSTAKPNESAQLLGAKDNGLENLSSLDEELRPTPQLTGAWPVAHDDSRRNSSGRKTEAQSTSSKNQPQESISHQGESNVRADLLTSPKLTRSTNSAPGANFALRAAIPFAGTLPPSRLPVPRRRLRNSNSLYQLRTRVSPMRTENSTPKDRLFGQTYLKNDFETLEDFRTFESSGSNEGFASPDREPHTNETTPSPDSLTKTFVHSSRERSFKSRAGKEWNVEGSSFGQISEHSTAPHLSRPESSTKHMGQDSVYSATRRQILCSPPRCNTAQSIIIQQSVIRSVVPRGSRASTFETAMASNCSKNSGLESIVESTSSPNLAEKKVSSWRVAAITSPAQGRSFSSMSRNYKNPSILSGSENGSMGYGAQLGADETVSAFGGRSIASGRVGSSGGERPIDYKAMTKLELFLLATKNRAKLDSVSSQFAVEKEGLLDALQELEEECHSATKERDQLLAELEQNTSSANKIEDQELLRELERAREEIFRLQSQVNQLELANSRLENRANSMANELKRAVVDLRTTTSTVSLKSQIPQSLIGKAVDRGSRTEKVELRAAERDKGKIRQKTVLLNPPVIGDLHDRSSNRSTLSPQRASFNKLDEQRSSLLAMNSALSQCSVSLNNTTFKFGSECSLSDDGAEDEDGFGRLTLIQTGGRKPLFSSSIEEQEEDAAEENREEGEEPYGVEVDGGQDHEEEKQEDEDEKDSDEEKYHDVNYDHEGTESTSPCSTVFADHRTRRRRDGGGSRYHDLGGEESSQYYDQNHSGRRGGVSKNNGSGSVNDRNYGIGRSLGNDEDEDNYDFRGSTGMDIGLELKREDQIFLEDLEDHDQLVLNESYGDGAESVF